MGKVRGRRLTVCKKKVLQTVATALVSLMAECDTFVSLSLVVELTSCDLVSYCLATKKAVQQDGFFSGRGSKIGCVTLRRFRRALIKTNAHLNSELNREFSLTTYTIQKKPAQGELFCMAGAVRPEQSFST